MIVTGQVLDISSVVTPDGSTAPITLGRNNEQLTAELHGKYFAQCYRGNLFYASTTTAGVVIPIASTLTPTYSLWNPAGSGKLMVPIVTLIGWTVTAAALGSFVWHLSTRTGDSLSAEGPVFSAFGTGTPRNANIGSGKVSVMRIATGGTTTIVTPAATFYRETGISALVTGTGLNLIQQPWFQARDDWDGSGILPPGNALHLLGSTAIAVTACITTVYYETPL